MRGVLTSLDVRNGLFQNANVTLVHPSTSPSAAERAIVAVNLDDVIARCSAARDRNRVERTTSGHLRRDPRPCSFTPLRMTAAGRSVVVLRRRLTKRHTALLNCTSYTPGSGSPRRHRVETSMLSPVSESTTVA